MRDNFNFGGGAATSSMTVVVFAIMLFAALLLLFLPKKYALGPFLVAVFLTPFGQVLNIAGAHFGVSRILAAVGVVRLLAAMLLSPDPVFAGGLNRLDKLFCVWSLVRGLAFILLFRETGALINQVGLWLDAFGCYLLFRHLIRGEEDVFRAVKFCVPIVSVLAACMFFEFATRVNVFSYLAGYAIVPWLREGRVRAQGAFANSITGGTFGATMLPLFFWLWKSGKARILGLLGVASASVVAVTSMASTPITGYLAGGFALCLWPLRRNMKLIRWGLVAMIAALAMVMKAPVWYIITKINIAGGQSWDRAYLIDQAMRHISDWWLLGTKDNASWGYFTWDQCNQYINEGLQGGILTMLLFLAMISMMFSLVGRCRKQSEGGPGEWYFWSLGAAIFAHVIVFLGVDYFDQTRVLWVLFVAMISAATFPVLSEATSPSPASGPLPQRYRDVGPYAAPGPLQPSVPRFTAHGGESKRPLLPAHRQQTHGWSGFTTRRQPRSVKE